MYKEGFDKENVPAWGFVHSSELSIKIHGDFEDQTRSLRHLILLWLQKSRLKFALPEPKP